MPHACKYQVMEHQKLCFPWRIIPKPNYTCWGISFIFLILLFSLASFLSLSHVLRGNCVSSLVSDFFNLLKMKCDEHLDESWGSSYRFFLIWVVFSLGWHILWTWVSLILHDGLCLRKSNLSLVISVTLSRYKREDQCLKSERRCNLTL